MCFQNIIKWFSLFIYCLFSVSISIAEEDGSENKAPEEESPWVLSPSLSSDPKLGTSAGGVVGYLFKLDDESNRSIVLTKFNYSSTSSWTAGGIGQMYFDSNKQKLIIGLLGGEIRNDYEDFQGSGISAQTTDNIKAFFTRYSYLVTDDWYAGIHFVSSNYVIGAEDIFADYLQQIGLTGFDSNGLGVVAQYDTRNHVRNPTDGNFFEIFNIAYRESLGGDDSFDTYSMKFSKYITHGNMNIFAAQIRGRWTSDAPIGGYSTVNLRGYVRGNYLAPHSTLLEADERIMFSPSWGMTVFGGVSCLYDTTSDCDESDNLFPAIGFGAIYVLKKKAGIVLRAEFAKGKSDERVLYVTMGNPF